jgi:hypothetical protein
VFCSGSEPEEAGRQNPRAAPMSGPSRQLFDEEHGAEPYQRNRENFVSDAQKHPPDNVLETTRIVGALSSLRVRVSCVHQLSEISIGWQL